LAARAGAENVPAAVRWYLRYGLSCPDGEEFFAERGIEVDHDAHREANTRIEDDHGRRRTRLRPTQVRFDHESVVGWDDYSMPGPASVTKMQ